MKSKQELIEEWESAIEAVEFYRKGKEERLISYMKYFVSDLNQLDEPEVSSQELPVIPNYVAKWISGHRERFDLYPALKRLENNVWNQEDVHEWYRKNTHTFVNAYLTGKYEVEEEQKYYVLNNEKYFLLGKDKGHGFIFSTGGNSKLGSMERTSATFELTEQEIKDYDERYWPFAVKVEELD